MESGRIKPAKVLPKTGWLGALFLGMFLVYPGSSVSGAACVGDLRSVDISRQRDQVLLNVRLVRRWVGESGTAGVPGHFAVRPDAKRVSAAWLKSRITNVEKREAGRGLSMPANLEGWKTARRTGSRLALPEVDAGESLTLFVKYEILESDFAGLWWVSYKPPEGGSAKCAFVLSVPGDEAVFIKREGAWTAKRGAAKHRNTYRWRLDLTGGADSGKAYILAGRQTTWERVGQGMERALVQDDEALPAGHDLMKPFRDLQGVGSRRRRIERAFEMIDSFEKRPPSLGLKARPLASVLEKRAGNCKDLSLALARGLEAAGVESWLVYRSPSVLDLNETMPCPYLFNHTLVAVPAETGCWFLDPVAGSMRQSKDLQLARDTVVQSDLLIVRHASKKLNKERQETAQ